MKDDLNVNDLTPDVRQQLWWVEKIVLPVCAACMVAPMVIFTAVVLFEVIKHG